MNGQRMAEAAEPGPVGATKAAAGTDDQAVVISSFDSPGTRSTTAGARAVVEMIARSARCALSGHGRHRWTPPRDGGA